MMSARNLTRDGFCSGELLLGSFVSEVGVPKIRNCADKQDPVSRRNHVEIDELGDRPYLVAGKENVSEIILQFANNSIR